ncbi:SulP family inorganic anion transporter [Granulicella sp. dw_53]|uniref:SulP family inorganic anion transporter n=1 Tax=Granulicella sp. dw_53 TaxID=2719792 RepID=UPI001BD28FA8|nr:SulP family inorganic anion transporter [Granulicella sp. dw_53]
MKLSPNYVKDISASLVVFLVALPLCMGIALASGASPAKGILTGIIGGIVVGCFSGSPLQVSGPAAGLAVIVFEIIRDHGITALGPILILAGIVQIVAGVLKAGRWFRAISPAVIHGMLAGIGLLIVLQQFHVMLDHKPKGTGLANLKAMGPAIFQDLFPIDGSAEERAILLALLVIAIMTLWQRFRPEKLKLIPGALLGIVAASTVAQLMHLQLNYVQVPGNLLDVISLPTLTSLTHLDRGIIGSALAIAFIASAETLLSAAAVDKMQASFASPIKTNYDRELIAQGIGNTLCGFVGSIPMTGVIVRSSANVQAGATSRLSAILHGVWILAIVALFPGLLRLVPICSLAGVLVFTGFNLIKVKDIRHLARFGKIPVLIYLATLVTIVTTDLLTGVLVGVTLSVLKLLYKATHLKIYTEPYAVEGHLNLHLQGSATFVRIPLITAVLDSIPAGSTVHLRTEQLNYIDHSCLDLMQEWISNSQNQNMQIVMEQHALEHKYWSPASVPKQAA